VENQTKSSTEIIFAAKNYRIVGGLSHLLHSATDDIYQVKALLGKGLGL